MKGLEEKIREMIKAHAQEMRLGDKRAEQFYDSLFSGEANPKFATVGLIDTGGDHELYLKCNENLGADRILNLVVGNAERTITLSGNPTLADWFDQSVKQAASPQFAGLHVYKASGVTEAKIESDDNRARLVFDSAANSFSEFYFQHAGALKWAFSATDVGNYFGVWDQDGIGNWHTQWLQGGGMKLFSLKSGATQAAAGAAANELWKTAGHATLPNNVVMIGV